MSKSSVWSFLVLLGCLLTLSGCSSGGSSSSADNTNSDGEVLSSLTTGYSVPSDISAVPEDTTSSASFLSRLSAFALASAATDLASTTDYGKAIPSKYIEEPVLDQFEIIEEVLGAIRQTNYNDPANINQGPYKSMIAWTDEEQGKEVKSLQPWVVDSRMIILNGSDVNRVLCWIEENQNGEMKTIKAEFKVYSPATFDAEGDVVDYGEWDLNVKFNDSGTNFFAASADPDGNGGTIIALNEFENFGGEVHRMKGVLHRSNSTGYGKMGYTDYESCEEWPCTPSIATAKYAYNEGYLAVKKNSAAVAYKDRSTKVEMTQRYGLFYDENPPTGVTAGDDVKKHMQFGFPVTFTDPDNDGREFAYYGAWQGRHQLWGGGESGIPAGTTVTKESWGSSAAAESYTVADALNGSFTKRTYVTAALGDILNVPVETFVDKHYDLFYNGSNWQYCKDGWVDWSSTPTCRNFSDNSTKAMTNFSAANFAALVVGAEDRKWVNINRWDNVAQQGIEYKYLAEDDGRVTWTSAGFYPATMGQNGTVTTADGSVYSPATNDQIWISVGGSIFIAYNGDFDGPTTTTGWVQKELVEFNTRNWQPVFGENDSEFSPDMGREYYMNASGVNYVVKRKATPDAAASYDVLLEIQKTANPENCTNSDCSTIMPSATSYLRTPWEPSKRYAIVTDSTSANYLLLVYTTDDPNTNDVDESAVETVVTQGMWGLQAYNSSNLPIDGDGAVVSVDEWGMPTTDTRPIEFNWEYCDPSGGNCWGAQTYLKDESNNYVILSDPVALQSINVVNGAGDTKTVMLQYDGWLHGMPNLYDDLRQNGWTFTDDLKNKIINIAAGTAVTDGTDGYYLKPLATSVFLESTTAGAITGAGDTVPDVTLADGIDMDTDVPSYVEHGIGDMPAVTTVKYVEGVLVE